MSAVGQSLRSFSASGRNFVRCYPKSDLSGHGFKMSRSATRVIAHCRNAASLFANHEDQTLGWTCASIAAPVRSDLSVAGTIATKNSDQGFAPGSGPGQALDPRGKEVKFQGVTSVLPTRKPRLTIRKSEGSPRRAAARRFCGSLTQEPPRPMRELQSPLIHGEPSVGAPL